MIFRVEVNVNELEAKWTATITSPDDPGWNPIERTGALDPAGYPLPPPADSVTRATRYGLLGVPDPALELCDAHQGLAPRPAAYERFVRQDPTTGGHDVEAFGGYLFSVLFGDDWNALVAAEPGPIRLRLVLAAAPALWSKLPWELMIGPRGPLVEENTGVSITRIVRGPAAGAPGIVSIDIPLRVLFVFGPQLDDQVRAADEYLTTLRQLQCTLPDASGSRGIALRTRLLKDATASDLETAVKEFAPNVVHLITHGQVQNRRPVVFLTAFSGTNRSKPKPDPVSAERFASIVHAASATTRPLAVILNACNTAEVGEDVPVSFAAELVGAGIPIVVGMAGAVADTACRLFTRQFYRALVNEEPADLAAAKGRRAALIEFKDYTRHYEWARAVFCQADGVDTRFAIDKQQQSLVRAAEILRPKNEREPFCGRTSWVPPFNDFLIARLGNLAIESGEEIGTQRLGKTRLLEEIAWNSVMEGWIPVFINPIEPYANLMHFGIQLFLLLEDRREKTFLLRPSNRSQLVKLACDAWGPAYAEANDKSEFLRLWNAVRQKLLPQQKISDVVDPALIWNALLDDVIAFKSDVEKVVKERRGVLLLWDRLDQQEAIGEDVVRALQPEGLGSDACPIRVVFTYSRSDVRAKKLTDAMKASSHIGRPQQLLTYSEVEARTAWRQYFRSKKLMGSRMKLDDFNKVINFCAGKTQYPTQFSAREEIVEFSIVNEVVVACDDDKILAENA